MSKLVAEASNQTNLIQTYAYQVAELMSDGSLLMKRVEVRAKGLSITNNVADMMSFETIKSVVLGSSRQLIACYDKIKDPKVRETLKAKHDEITSQLAKQRKRNAQPFCLVPDDKILRRKETMEVYSQQRYKTYSYSFNKRIVKPDFQTRPYGWPESLKNK